MSGWSRSAKCSNTTKKQSSCSESSRTSRQWNFTFQSAYGGDRNPLAKSLLPFRLENQGVCVWAARLDGSADPPVAIAYVDEPRWIDSGLNFSEHLVVWMWDYARVLGHELLIQAQNEALSAATLAFLREHFDAQRETRGWPTEIQYRLVALGRS
jgi:hypothetical protein